MELRFRCAFVSFLYKSEFQLIYVQLNVNYRRAQFAMFELAIMNYRLVMLDDEIGPTEAEGQAIQGPSMIIRRQTASICAKWPTLKSTEDRRYCALYSSVT